MAVTTRKYRKFLGVKSGEVEVSIDGETIFVTLLSSVHRWMDRTLVCTKADIPDMVEALAETLRALKEDEDGRVDSGKGKGLA